MSTPHSPDVDTDVRPFRCHVEAATLDDLRDRLARSRLLPASPDRPWSALDPHHLADLVSAWHRFDWRSREAWLNSHPQVHVTIDGAVVHAVHLRSRRHDAPALLVMHGWPHTFALQLDFARLLPDFHVVVASLPGFAFSSPYASGPLTRERLASTMHELMHRLGHTRYVTYGEDVSADVSDLIAARHPESVVGIVATHAHLPAAHERRGDDEPDAIAFFDRLARERHDASAYAHLQSTRPDTVAAALNDSPVGLLAWLVEKLAEWSDTPRDDPRGLESRISRDRILTEATIYWTTQTIASSFRPYYERVDEPSVIPQVEVPAAVFVQRHEYDYPESVARGFYRDLRRFERLATGGHFTVAEVPDTMARRVRSFAREIGVLTSD
jgi:epoxide hydrolase